MHAHETYEPIEKKPRRSDKAKRRRSRGKKQKAKESKSGEKAERKPSAPKEAPVLPHSEQQRLKGSVSKEEDPVVEKPKGAPGLAVRNKGYISMINSFSDRKHRNQQTSPRNP